HSPMAHQGRTLARSRLAQQAAAVNEAATLAQSRARRDRPAIAPRPARPASAGRAGEVASPVTQIAAAQDASAAPALPATLEKPIQAFLAYCRVECGFASATHEAYGRDLRDLAIWMIDQSMDHWRALEPGHLVEHLRHLVEVQALAPASVSR